jgi:cobalamin biosynthesis Mg chelatase CobN
MEGASVESSQPSQAQEATGNPARATTTQQSSLVDEATRVAATLNEKLPTLSQETPIHGNHRGATEPAREARARDENREATEARAAHAAQDASPSPDHAMRTASVTGTGEASAGVAPAAQADARGGRMRQRAASVSASVGENLRPRVEKLREASTVVFDEASDDPGLRFVIIAALLFLLFLFILLFSYILG